MQLNKEDRDLFYKLHPALLVFVNKQKRIIPKIQTIDDLMTLDIQQKVKIRNALYRDIDLIDMFYEKDPFNFREQELAIILSWKKYVKGEFIVYKQYKKYSVIFEQKSSPKVYGVLGISEPIEMVYPMLPVLMETVLLPFKDQIIFDGFTMTYPLFFGANIHRDLKQIYEEARAEYGIIERLPFSPPLAKERDAGLLRYYLKNENHRKYYEVEIDALINKNEDLRTLYYQELGKLYAKKYRKRMKELAILNAWFVILGDVIIASGKNREDAVNNAEHILPDNLQKAVFVFQIKNK